MVTMIFGTSHLKSSRLLPTKWEKNQKFKGEHLKLIVGITTLILGIVTLGILFL